MTFTEKVAQFFTACLNHPVVIKVACCSVSKDFELIVSLLVFAPFSVHFVGWFKLVQELVVLKMASGDDGIPTFKVCICFNFKINDVHVGFVTFETCGKRN